MLMDSVNMNKGYENRKGIVAIWNTDAADLTDLCRNI
jgi:hypothetical protein